MLQNFMMLMMIVRISDESLISESFMVILQDLMRLMMIIMILMMMYVTSQRVIN